MLRHKKHSLTIVATLALAAVACAPATQPAPTSAPAQPPKSAPAEKPAEAKAPAPKPADAKAPAAPADKTSQAEWQQALAAGKQEGKVAVVMAPGDPYRRVLEAFQAKHGIAFDLLAGGGPADLIPKIGNERQAGQYLWDVAVHNPISLASGFKSMGSLDPLRPALLDPEVTQDSKWTGGMAPGFADREKTLVYTFVGHLTPIVHVNRNVVPEADLNKLDQVWEPRWKGKIALEDPRVFSAGNNSMATWFVAKGEDKMKAFLSEQQPVVTQDRRQLAEWVIRGQYPLALGVQQPALEQLKAEGLSIDHVKPLLGDDPAVVFLSAGTGSVALMNRAPHPNAARVFINWLLSQEGLTVWSQQTGYNTRRVDVPPVYKVVVVEPNKTYINLQDEAALPTLSKVIEISKEILK